jgi:hypothetical protein
VFTSRPDGVLLTKLPGFRKIFPFLMVTRTESAIVHQQTIRVKRSLALLARLNEGRTGPKYTIFHIFLAAAVRTMALRPENNRFVVGRRIYQRKAIELAFIAKKALTDEAAETNVRLVFEPADTLEQVAARVWDRVSSTKKSSSSKDENLAETLSRLPRFLTRFLMWAFRVLDYFNLLPASAIKSDALYCSAYLANLGSIGLEAVEHHLFEWGTCSMFGVLGKIKKGVVVDDENHVAVEDVVTTAFTVDERATDGVNLAKTIALLEGFLEDPEPLMSPPASIPDPFALR